MLHENGYAKFKDPNIFLAWYSTQTAETARNFFKTIMDSLIEYRSKDFFNNVHESLRKLYDIHGGYICGNEELVWEKQKPERMRLVTHFIEMTVEYNQRINVYRWIDGQYALLYLGNRQSFLAVPNPEEYLEYEPEADLSDMTLNEVRAALGADQAPQNTELVPADAQEHLTTKALKETLNQQKNDIKDLESQMDDIKHAKTKELAALQKKIEEMQRQLEDKKEALMAELNEKMAEMQLIKEKMEMQIYLLDSQIYSIRCYAGEVVRFGQIRRGKNAPDNEPIVIHQKLRFLDEDLGQLASLYEIDWDNIGMFEDFLKYSPVALDTFVPNERCISLVRISRTATFFDRNDINPYSNMLKDYNYYHGRTIGILIRNGENVYLGWTDEERIDIADDLIISQVITDIKPDVSPKFYSKIDEERYLKEQKEQKKRLLDGIISRSFVYSILQGIVDNTSLLPLPKGVTLSKQSEYVIYAVADKWLSDNRFGSFTDIIEQCNATIQQGDMLLTVQRLVPEREYSSTGGYYSRTWDNVRGRGDKNRTHDAVVEDCSLYRANVVEYDDPVSHTRFKRLYKPNGWDLHNNPDAQPFWLEHDMETESYEFTRKDGNVEIPLNKQPDDIVLEVYDFCKRHVYVSAEKTDNWAYSSDARANVEVYPEEIINLTYMNSVWLEWVITNKQLGGWQVGGRQVNYAYAIRYLKTAMDYIRKREEEEKAILDAADPNICKDQNWPLKLSQWKLANHVRKITPYQAKRFTKYVYQ